MGLDIKAYSKAVRVGPVPLTDEEFDEVCESDLVIVNELSDFLQGLTPGVYSYEDTLGFRAGSYGGYNLFRRYLAQSVGYEPEDAWNDPGQYKHMPYFEMVNFSDCEGFIGTASCIELLMDFEAGRPKFMNFMDSTDDPDYYKDRYDKWLEAYRLAHDGGFIKFT